MVPDRRNIQEMKCSALFEVTLLFQAAASDHIESCWNQCKNHPLSSTSFVSDASPNGSKCWVAVIFPCISRYWWESRQLWEDKYSPPLLPHDNWGKMGHTGYCSMHPFIHAVFLRVYCWEWVSVVKKVLTVIKQWEPLIELKGDCWEREEQEYLWC